MFKVKLLDDSVPGDTAYVIGWDRGKYFYAVLADGNFTELRHWQIELKKSNKRYSLPYYPLTDTVPTHRDSSRELKRETSLHKTTYYVNVHCFSNRIDYREFKTLRKAFTFIRSLTHGNWTLSANFYELSSAIHATIADGREMTLFNLIGLPVSQKTVKRELEKLREYRNNE